MRLLKLDEILRQRQLQSEACAAKGISNIVSKVAMHFLENVGNVENVEALNMVKIVNIVRFGGDHLGENLDRVMPRPNSYRHDATSRPVPPWPGLRC